MCERSAGRAARRFMKRPHPVKQSAEWIVDRLKLDQPAGKRKKRNEEILLLAFGRREAVREYYVRIVSRILLLITVLFLLLIAAVIYTVRENRVIADGRIDRPDYMQQSRQEYLSVSGFSEGESEEQIEADLPVTVSGRRFSADQVSTLLENAMNEWQDMYLGDNASPDEVRSPLMFPASLQDGAVTAAYLTVPYGLVKEDGSIGDQVSDQGELVEIRADFTCQDTEESLLLSVRVFPAEKGRRETFRHALDQALEKADETEGLLPYLTLPGEVQGVKLTWSYPAIPYLKVAAAMLLLLPVVLWLIADSRFEESVRAREVQLKNDYGELMWKMTMLIGAGMTIRGTFFKIAATYKENGGQMRYAYEEVVRTCREMRSGVGEEQAYEDFGRRCGLTCYIRLGAVLSQNLRKGSKGLREALEQEAVTAMQDRRGSAKEMGEKAGTRLLLPMVMMLGVVIFVLIAPAFIGMA